MSMQEDWHILRVIPGTERDIAEVCRGETYVPTRPFRAFIRRQRKVVERRVPALPGYLFLRTGDPRTAFHRTHASMRGFLRNGDRSYALLRDKDVSLLHEMEALLESEYLASLQPSVSDRRYRRNDTVQVTDGPFRDLVGVVQRMKGNNVLLDIVGSKYPVLVKACEVQGIMAVAA